MKKKFKIECSYRWLILHLKVLLESWYLVLRRGLRKVLKIQHGNIVITRFPKRNTIRGIFKKVCILRSFVFYLNFSKNIGFRQLEEDWPNLDLLNIPYGRNHCSNKIYLFKNLSKKYCMYSYHQWFFKISHFTTFAGGGGGSIWCPPCPLHISRRTYLISIWLYAIIKQSF